MASVWPELPDDASSDDAYFSDARGVRRPFLLRGLHFAGLIAMLVAVIFSIAAPQYRGEYYINDRTLTGHEFLAAGGVPILLAICSVWGSGWLLRGDSKPLPADRRMMSSGTVTLTPPMPTSRR